MKKKLLMLLFCFISWDDLFAQNGTNDGDSSSRVVSSTQLKRDTLPERWAHTPAWLKRRMVYIDTATINDTVPRILLYLDTTSSSIPAGINTRVAGTTEDKYTTTISFINTAAVLPFVYWTRGYKVTRMAPEHWFVESFFLTEDKKRFPPGQIVMDAEALQHVGF